MPYCGYHSYTYSSDRLMFQDAELYAELIHAVCQMAKEPLPHIVCGMGASGIPMATLLADRLKIGLCVLRKSQNESPHDSSWGIGPDIHEVDTTGRYILRYLFVDDLVASGSTVRRMEFALRRVYPWHYRKSYGVWLQDKFTDKAQYDVGCENFPSMMALVGGSHHIAEWKGRLIKQQVPLTALEYCERKRLTPIAKEPFAPGILCGVDKHEACRGQTIGHKETDRLSSLLPQDWWS